MHSISVTPATPQKEHVGARARAGARAAPRCTAPPHRSHPHKQTHAVVFRHLLEADSSQDEPVRVRLRQQG
jgi:hypothetical protein